MRKLKLYVVCSLDVGLMAPPEKFSLSCSSTVALRWDGRGRAVEGNQLNPGEKEREREREREREGG